MDVTTVTAEVDAVVQQQLDLLSGDPAVEQAAALLLTALQPGLERAAMRLAEQAAAEVGAQLPDTNIDVVVSEGDPTLVVRSGSSTAAFVADDLEARLTLRLPATLKEQIEEAAGQAGDSINSYLVKSLSRSSARRATGRRVSETLQT